MTRIRVVNRTRGTLVGNRIVLVDSFPGRLRGYLGRPEPKTGEGILLVPCRAVHTFGVRFALDLIFLDREGSVVRAIEALPPFTRTSRINDARFALEVPPGSIETTYTRVGDRFAWMSPEPVFFFPSPVLEGLREFEPRARFRSSGRAGVNGSSKGPTKERAR